MNQCNLKGIYNELWIALETAIVDRKSSFHTFSLATVNNEFADNRTVVLRGCNKDKMILSFNTNNSSDKIAHISKNNNVSALFYDIDINILSIDWLYLSASGHSRAKYTKENNYEGEWIAP
jgi:pyridoxine/pyridoxamine 5'-phosphate oxidase